MACARWSWLSMSLMVALIGCEREAPPTANTASPEPEKRSPVLAVAPKPDARMYAHEAASVARLHQQAEGGNTEAQFMLAQRYLTGMGVSADAQRAKAYLEQAAAGGHGEAKLQLATLQWQDEAALRLLEEAVNEQVPGATWYLAQRLAYDAQGQLTQDTATQQRVLELLKPLLSDPEAVFAKTLYGKILLSQGQWEEARAPLAEAAQNGDPEAQDLVAALEQLAQRRESESEPEQPKQKQTEPKS